MKYIKYLHVNVLFYDIKETLFQDIENLQQHGIVSYSYYL